MHACVQVHIYTDTTAWNNNTLHAKSFSSVRDSVLHISFYVNQNNSCQRDQESNGKISLGKCLCGKGYCHTRGLALLCLLDLLVLGRDGALHQISKVKAAERFRFPPLLTGERQRNEMP